MKTHAAFQKINAINASYELSPRQAKILDHVSQFHHSGQNICVGDLCKALDSDSSRAVRTELLNLHKKELLTIEINFADMRERLIKPSLVALERLKELDLIFS
jgi:DNA-binding MarR family transcriptional regulator